MAQEPLVTLGRPSAQHETFRTHPLRLRLTLMFKRHSPRHCILPSSYILRLTRPTFFCSLQLHLVCIYLYILFIFIMSQVYRSVPREEPSPSGRDDASVNEKFEWQAEKTTLSHRIRSALSSNWVLVVQAVMLSASITFFALGVCMRSAKQADAIPMTFCENGRHR